jgi:hypothetical protein
MTDRPAFKHGTAEAWIIAAGTTIIVALVAFLVRTASNAYAEQAKKFDAIYDRVVKVETQTQAIHLQFVDVPNMKIEQARHDLRLQALEARMRDLDRTRGSQP